MYLGVDCGTQSLKVVGWDPDSESLVSSSESCDLISGLPPGHKEQHPQDWIDALDACMKRLAGLGADLSRVRAIGVSGQQHGLVLLDGSDRVLRPAKLWNDTSTGDQCRRILEAAGGLDTYREEIGNSLPPGFTASKVLWVKENEPDTYRRISSILLPHDYLNLYLTGEKTAEAGDASGTGYFQVARRSWSDRALGWLDPQRDLRACLPRLIGARDPAGQLRPSLARKWGLPGDVRVSSGGGDNMMGAIGSGNVSGGKVTVSLGTSGTLYGYSSTPVLDPQGEIAAFCDSTGGWLPLACTMNVTVATEMVRSGFSSDTLEEFNRRIEGVPPGAEGLILLPYLEGERMPNLPEGTGVLLGLRPRTARPGHLARASMEGVTLGLRYGLDRLRELGARPDEIRLIGGGSRSRVWRQIAADVFGCPVVTLTQEEGPAFGAALQAAWCREEESLETWVDRYVRLDENTRRIPSRSGLELYEQVYSVYRSLSDTLIDSPVFPGHRQLIHRKD
jgi:xylulokinase